MGSFAEAEGILQRIGLPGEGSFSKAGRETALVLKAKNKTFPSCCPINDILQLLIFFVYPNT